MNKLLVICGPTAVGKTGLGIKLAKKFGGEIVSADSRQVYKGMDIGTGKELPVNPKFEIPAQFYLSPSGSIRTRLEEQFWAGRQNSKFQIGYYLVNKTRIWMLDVVEPDYRFSVADYVRCAELVIKDIWKRGRLPILVGGTGFYIKGIVDGIETMGIKQDWKLRERLTSCRVNELTSLLKKLDSERWKLMNESDRKNPRRLVRAIEVALQIRNSKSETLNKSQIQNSPDFSNRESSTPTLCVECRDKFKTKNTLFIGLMAPNEILYERIDKRVDERVKQGIIDEIKRLLKMGYSWENSVLGQTIGYKEWKEYLKNSKTQKLQNSKLREEIIRKWKYNEHGYARRQMTWFRKDKRINWFDISKKGWENEVENLVEKLFSIN